MTELAVKGTAALSVEEKKTRGAAVNVAKRIEAALNECAAAALAEAELQRQLQAEALDVTLPGQRAWHRRADAPVSLTLERIEAIFGSMGFEVADGPGSSATGRNFTALPTRPRTIPRARCTTPSTSKAAAITRPTCRTRTSPMQVRHRGPACPRTAAGRWRGLRTGAMPEIRVIVPGRTYRVDSDATHSPMFHQCEGLWIGENISFKDLKFVFTDFCRTFFESDDLVRFRPSFFPSPSRAPRSTSPSRAARWPDAGSRWAAAARCTRTWCATWGWTPSATSASPSAWARTA